MTHWVFMGRWFGFGWATFFIEISNLCRIR
nr:MAG TPA: Z1 domain protein [Caudoviricetes sp.]